MVNYFFVISVYHYFPPFTLNFTEQTQSSLFNSNYPNPVCESPVTFGSINNTVRFRVYELSVEQFTAERTGD
jgi:hypothetical protein